MLLLQSKKFNQVINNDLNFLNYSKLFKFNYSNLCALKFEPHIMKLASFNNTLNSFLRLHNLHTSSISQLQHLPFLEMSLYCHNSFNNNTLAFLMFSNQLYHFFFSPLSCLTFCSLPSQFPLALLYSSSQIFLMSHNNGDYNVVHFLQHSS